ncbi:TPA: excisionase [Escherichia coli]
MYLTLQEWNARQRRPRSLETVRRWVRECRIFPPPVKDGREYLFHESAVKVDLNRPPRFYVSTSKSIIKALINMHSFEIQLSPIG